MQKKQNTRRSLADSVHRIYQAGMVVIAGFIVGFDTEAASVAEAMADCIEATSIPIAWSGLLAALPNTQLTRRLEKEGRLLPIEPGQGDQCTAGLNFVTLRPRRDVLADFRAVLASDLRSRRLFRAGPHAGPHARSARFAAAVSRHVRVARAERPWPA